MEISFRKMTKDDIPAPGDHWIEVTKGMSGWFAVEMWLNDEMPELGPFPEPYQTGIGRYSERRYAVGEAKEWAQIEGLPYRIEEGV